MIWENSMKHVYYQVWNRSPVHVGCMRQVLGAGALEWPRGMGWRGKWERGSGCGTHVNPWLIHASVWQKPPQHYKVISLQLIKIKEKKNCPHSCFQTHPSYPLPQGQKTALLWGWRVPYDHAYIAKVLYSSRYMNFKCEHYILLFWLFVFPYNIMVFPLLITCFLSILLDTCQSSWQQWWWWKTHWAREQLEIQYVFHDLESWELGVYFIHPAFSTCKICNLRRITSLFCVSVFLSLEGRSVSTSYFM